MDIEENTNNYRFNAKRIPNIYSQLTFVLDVQVLNLTELELNRVDIRVGLSGALYFMDGSPQAVRQLRNLVSQV